jgi:hypothetical protein
MFSACCFLYHRRNRAEILYFFEHSNIDTTIHHATDVDTTPRLASIDMATQSESSDVRRLLLQLP